jgi:hypothetical protein
MNKNTLIAVIAICMTINILAGGYLFLINFSDNASAQTAISPQMNKSAATFSLPADMANQAVAESNNNQNESVIEEESLAQKSKPIIVKKSKRQDIINHLDKYLNLVPSSNPRPKDGFDNINFTIVNKSGYTFDEVVINFKCYLDNGSLWTEKNFTVGPVGPNGSVSQNVPNQIRGSRIEWKTVSIKSSELDFAWQQ